MGGCVGARSDRFEDLAVWTVMSAALLTGILAALVGWSVGTQALAHGRAAAAELTRTDAVLLDTAPLPVGGYRSAGTVVRVAAAWTAPGGGSRTGLVTAIAGTPAGTVIPVWTDRYGAADPAPAGPAECALDGVLAGLGVLVVGGCVLSALWMAFRRFIDGCNAAYWEREWERVEPQWSRHPR